MTVSELRKTSPSALARSLRSGMRTDSDGRLLSYLALVPKEAKIFAVEETLPARTIRLDWRKRDGHRGFARFFDISVRIRECLLVTYPHGKISKAATCVKDASGCIAYSDVSDDVAAFTSDTKEKPV